MKRFLNRLYCHFFGHKYKWDFKHDRVLGKSQSFNICSRCHKVLRILTAKEINDSFIHSEVIITKSTEERSNRNLEQWKKVIQST